MSDSVNNESANDTARTAAFLAEMGITPQWTLRAPPQPATPAPAPANSPAPARATDGGDRPTGLSHPAPVPARAATDTHVYADEAEAAQEADDDGMDAALDAAHELAAATPRPHIDMTAPEQPDYIVAASQALAGAYKHVAPPVQEFVEPGPSDEELIARMDWPELDVAIANCTRCGICKDGRKPVPGRGARQAVWMVAAGASSAVDEQGGAPLSGEPGRLLVNMLAAVGHAAEHDTYITNLVKCRPTNSKGGDRAPTQDEAIACRPFLARELELTGATMLLTLGQIAANALQDQPLQSPLSGARGRRHTFNGVPMVATLHPGELLRRGADKALAWADLCLANSADDSAG
jgi:uracil-DNA glycosylase family 4